MNRETFWRKTAPPPQRHHRTKGKSCSLLSSSGLLSLSVIKCKGTADLLEGEGSTRIARISTNFPQSERPAEVVQIREIRVEQCVHRDSIEQSHSMDRDRPNECSD